MVKLRVDFGMLENKEPIVVKLSRIPCVEELISINHDEASYTVHQVCHFSKPDYDGSVGMIRVRRGNG